LQKEGITCAVCHVRNGTVIGPFGNTNAPHPVKKDLSQLSVDSCLKCHNASADLTDTLVCRFTTGEEWRSSSYPARGQDCVTCHMPEVKRPLVNTEGFSQRKVRRHSWRGSGIAKFLGQEEEAKDFYMSGFNIRIETPKTAYDAEEMVKASIHLKNAYAGHFLPTGDVEYFYIINMNARDEEDRIIAEKKERVGQLWKWYPKAEKVSDNSYRPFEERTYSLDFSFPKLSDRVKLEVAIQTHRMTKENAQTMGLLGGYPISAQTNRKQLVLHKRKP
jgi:hypothetical protein